MLHFLYKKISSNQLMKALVIYRMLLYYIGVINEQYLTYKNKSKTCSFTNTGKAVHMTVATSLFAPDAVYSSEKTSKEEGLEEVYGKLLKAGYVKGDFLSHIIEREEHYPTGIDTSPISKELPNVAIPHTEGEFVNARLIVPIALKHPIKFQNMIEPDSLPISEGMIGEIENNYSQAWQIIQQIKELMQEKLQIKLSLSEQTYLTIHIQRLI